MAVVGSCSDMGEWLPPPTYSTAQRNTEMDKVQQECGRELLIESVGGSVQVLL